MADIPKFSLYGETEPQVDESIQSTLPLRAWYDLSYAEKEIALQELRNLGWLSDGSSEILSTIYYLNHHFLRSCPGQNLHKIAPQRDSYGRDNSAQRREAAANDFELIFLNEESDALVLRMLSKLADAYIDKHFYTAASKETDEEKQQLLVASAFEKFDRLASALNHIFEQFSVNQLVTRSGIVPRQENLISDVVYKPTLQILSAPKWASVDADLRRMFEDYRDCSYAEAITKAHSAVHRFLQIIAGEEGKSGKGEVGKLFAKAKFSGKIPVNKFTEPLISVLQNYFPSERATNSTAKPALKEAGSSDALLMMNLVMVFLQHCLQAGN